MRITKRNIATGKQYRRPKIVVGVTRNPASRDYREFDEDPVAEIARTGKGDQFQLHIAGQGSNFRADSKGHMYTVSLTLDEAREVAEMVLRYDAQNPV